MASLEGRNPAAWPAGKTLSLALLLVSEVAAMSVWFATTASLAGIREEWHLGAFQEALLTSSVQAGFVAGTLVSALLSLPDRLDLRRLFCGSALVAAAANAAILAFEPIDAMVPLLRFVTGMCMAGVYPVGMKLASTWAERDLGLLIGLLIAALTLGSASPHLLAAFGGVDWRVPYMAASAAATLAGVLIIFARIGPNVAKAPPLRLGNALEAWRNRPLRLANLGYLGHMWELYAMWAWFGVFIHASFAQTLGEDSSTTAKLATFAVVAAGAVGALAGGWLADRWGRTLVTSASMAISGVCALTIGLLFHGPPALVVAVGMVWGISIIADSGQFSATVAELSDRSLVGTMLTIQTCIGFLLTLASIHLLPYVVDLVGWTFAFSVLAIGPFLGIVAMLRLRADPAALSIAGGKR
ncbi:MFS transporter (plasmid) [Skermanella mucosa]|uniref:MFS transporter n=1 Tax=Skermanella mucosa TaxID=1789672 RepID=UPI00192CC1D4|nr:MFS transporter [Skermanella mucosa]UEM24474.1 MFS transporter [Skermanella mucosa]